jgi:hypothetical protein
MFVKVVAQATHSTSPLRVDLFALMASPVLGSVCFGSFLIVHVQNCFCEAVEKTQKSERQAGFQDFSSILKGSPLTAPLDV